MPPETFPLVDAGDIIRLVGPISFQRGRDYGASGAVVELEWDASTLVLTSEVEGSGAFPYHCRVRLSEAHGKFSQPVSSACSCPMSFDCKHVAATLLASNALSVRAGFPVNEPAPAPVASWKSAVGALAGIAAASSTTTTALGLQFELRELIPRTRSRWNGPSAKPATAPPNLQAEHRLGVRPVIRSKTGNWVRANVTWSSLGYQGNRLDVSAQQVRWFAQFAALQRASREMYSGQEPDWIYLDDFHSPLLWRLFAEAGSVGVSLVGTKKDARVVIGQTAHLSLDARVTNGPITLSPVLSIDQQPFSVASSAAIGDHGVYSWSLEPNIQFTLAPTPATLTDEQVALLGQHADVVVPADDVEEFLTDFYPRLARAIAVTSSDESVALPEITAPVLVLTVTFAAKQTVKLGWHWAYGAVRKPLGGHDERDELVEAATLERVGAVLEVASSTSFQGLDAAEFASHVLPTLERLEGVRVEFVGKRPDYRELTETPTLKIKTLETDKRDWFDLGVYVTVEGRDVPFTKLFKALSQGKTKLLLVDNSYLSLTQPVFDELRRLIEEASTLDEWETGVRISRYQAALWSDFEDLADETEQAVAWRDAAAGLNAVVALEPAPLPPGLNATLRPYQQDGFDWLAFLWQHQLGGVLADDMGLGKTLQALALVAHASAAEPFLVVAPTSVVSNWLAEAARFVPGLTVAGVTSTKQDLAALAQGAHIVVTSYALFRLGFANYQKLTWAGLILDEAQFVKNAASKAHECAVDLNTPFKLAITGTPLENSLTDLWSLFHIVAPGLFASGRRFAEEYVRPIAAGAGPEVMAKLRRRIRPLMMRRTKELVATDLPAKQEQVLNVELSPRHRTLYDTFLQKERQKLLGLIDDLDKNRFIVFRSITLLRMLSLDASLVDKQYSDIPSAKLDSLFEQLDDVVAEGHRALVFSQFTSFLKKAASRMDAAGIPYEYLDGSTLKRADVIARYKTGDAPVFLISLKAGGFGLNLTEADYVFVLDPWWNPASETQAIDRTHRIGQTRPVNVYRLVSAGTIEEKVMALKEKKAQLFDAVMDDDAVFSTALTADDIRGLLE
jgi:superfamily II DNA or RNA helicase